LVRFINERVYALAEPGMTSRPGTTLTAAVLWRDTLVLAHVGDSRAYLLRDGHAQALTEDHTLVAEQVRLGAMTEDDARHSPFRSSLMRCIGNTPTAEVDLGRIEVRDGDVLLLCSDGLSEYVGATELAAVLGAEEIEPAAARLCELALERGGQDNVTIVAAQIGDHQMSPAGVAEVADESDEHTLLLRRAAVAPVLAESYAAPEATGAPKLAARPVATHTGLAPGTRTTLLALTLFVATAGVCYHLVSQRHAIAQVTPVVSSAPPAADAPVKKAAAAEKAQLLFSADKNDVVVGVPSAVVTVTAASGYTATDQPAERCWRITLLHGAAAQQFDLAAAATPGTPLHDGRLSAAGQEVRLVPGEYTLRVGANKAKLRPVATLTVTASRAAP
jgi:hypothetical protein